jgi:hypothetical protein
MDLPAAGRALQRERQPVRTGRPGEVVQGAVRFVGDDDQVAGGGVGEAQHALGVAEGEPAAVGRPLRRVQETLQALRQLARCLFALVVDEPQLLFAAAVADERHRAAVRRERRVLVVGAGGAREVADVAVFARHRQHVAAGAEHGAAAAGAQCDALDVALCGHAAGAHQQAFVGYADRDRLFAARARVEPAQLATFLVDDAVVLRAAGAGPAHVPLQAIAFLVGGARRRIVRPQVQRAAAVTDEPDAVVDPHRVAVGARVVADVGGAQRHRIERVEILRPAALVALPAAEVAEQG